MRLLICFLMISSPVYALTEAQVRESVISRFPLVEAAVIKWQSAKAEVIAAEGAFDHKLKFKAYNRIEDRYDNEYFETSLERNLPVYGIDLIAGHRQGTGDFPPYNRELDTSSAGEIFAGISFPLLQNLSTDERRTNLILAQLDRKQAEEQMQLKKNIYVHKALIIYYKYLLEEKKLKIKQEILQLAEDRIKMMRAKFKSGDVAQLKVVDTERSIRKRQDEVLKSEVALNSLRAQLSLFVPDFAPVLTESPLDSIELRKPDLPPAINFSTIPQTQIIEMERKKAAVLTRLYQQSQLPSLNLEVLGFRELSRDYPYDPETLKVGVKFSYPLENRKAEGKTVAQVYKTGAVIKQQEYTVRELSRSYDYALKALELTLKRWKNLRKEVENTKTMAIAEKKRWEQGSSDLYLVSLREEDVADAEIRKWSSLFEFKQHLLDARLFLGTI